MSETMPGIGFKIPGIVILSSKMKRSLPLQKKGKIHRFFAVLGSEQILVVCSSL